MSGAGSGTPGSSSSRAAGGDVAGDVAAVSGEMQPPTLTPTPSAEATTGQQGTEETIEVDDDVVIGSKRKLKSAVWLDFDKILVANEWKARCNWCKKYLSAVSRNGTTHLKNHLESCEHRQTRKGLKQSTLKLSKNQDGTVNVDKYVFDQELCRKELALMICVHEYPLSMVDHAGFRKFCAAMQPLFKVVSRNTIRKDILDMYEVQRLSMVRKFQHFLL
ncbi:hypothetical protein ACP70R_008566 [Stipagrostis hirtigluma subsp. patula]